MKKIVTKLLVITGVSFSSSFFGQTARVQVIHNSADAAASTVDVWLDNTLLIDNFNFRTASPFGNAPADVGITIGIAPANSTSSAQSIATFPVTLASNETYVVVANGIVSATGYTPAPAFDLNIYAMGREQAAVSGNTDLLVVHGSTDAPTVDVVVPGVGTVVNDISYSEFSNYLEVPTANYTINVSDATGATVVASYQAPLQTLGLSNAALVVVASGFLNPANNSNSTNTFGLWVALPAGGNLIPLTITTSVVENSGIEGLTLFPNPASNQIAIQLNATESLSASISLSDLTGKLIRTIQTGSISAGNYTTTLDVSDLANGIYNLNVSHTKGSVNKRISVSH